MFGKQGRFLGVGMLVVAVVGLGAFTARRQGASENGQEGRSAQGRRPPPERVLEVRDGQRAFAISYPEGWTSAAPTESGARVAVAPDGRNSLLLRVVPMEFAVGEAELPSMKEYTRRVVTSGEQVEIREGPQDAQQGGLQGFSYLYSFRDPGSGQTGLHSHFFFFADKAMVTVVFQALPEDEFPRLSPVFQSLLGSFRSLAPPPAG